MFPQLCWLQHFFCPARACAPRGPGDRGRGSDGTVGYGNNGRRQGGSTKLGWQRRRRHGLPTPLEQLHVEVPCGTRASVTVAFIWSSPTFLPPGRPADVPPAQVRFRHVGRRHEGIQIPTATEGRSGTVPCRAWRGRCSSESRAARLFSHRSGRPMCRSVKCFSLL